MSLLIECPCGNWEELPVHEQRHHAQSFFHLGDDYFTCLECAGVVKAKEIESPQK